MKSKHQAPRSAGRIFLAFGVVWGALSLLFLFLGLRSIRAERRFQAECMAVPGIVASKRVQEKNGIDPSTKRPIVSRNYYMTASFTDDLGHAREIETHVSAERWESAREDEAVVVQYLPADPAGSRIADDSAMGGARVVTGLGALGVLIGLGVGLRGLRVARENSGGATGSSATTTRNPG